jgi:hypothetical protein
MQLFASQADGRQDKGSVDGIQDIGEPVERIYNKTQVNPVWFLVPFAIAPAASQRLTFLDRHFLPTNIMDNAPRHTFQALNNS